MPNRSNFSKYPSSFQDAFIFQALNELAQGFGAPANDLTLAQLTSERSRGKRLGSIYETISALSGAAGIFNGAADGLGTLRVARATFNPSGVAGHRTVASHGLGVTIPDNAVVVGGWLDIITTFADGVADAATIALTLQTAGDLVAAISIATGVIWDSGQRGVLPGNFALDGNALTAIGMAALRSASHIKLTAAREITATVGGVALTAGKMNIFLTYVQGE